MKYLLLIYANPESPWTGSAEDYESLRELVALSDGLSESGELISGEALAGPGPVGAKTVRVRDGVRAVTDGPFVEAKEHLAGYLLVECESPERAEEIAANTPMARSHAMEIRPIFDQDVLRRQVDDYFATRAQAGGTSVK